jgi:hypothetical protein
MHKALTATEVVDSDRCHCLQYASSAVPGTLNRLAPSAETLMSPLHMIDIQGLRTRSSADMVGGLLTADAAAICEYDPFRLGCRQVGADAAP